MRARSTSALLVGIAVLATANVAAAAPCVTGAPEQPVVGCFDPGNRLVLEGGTGGVRVALALRHVVTTDDPSVTWRMTHALVDARWDGARVKGALYQARYVRHSTDGHIMFPTSPPTRLHFPFDLGVELGVGLVDAAPRGGDARLGVFRVAPMFDLVRASDFRVRLAVGARGRWDLALADDGSAAHVVAPLSEGELALHLESRDGLTVVDGRGHAGRAWSTATGWGTSVGGELGAERTLFALNDQPVAAFAQGGWSSDDALGSPAEPRGLWGMAGLRVGVGSARR